MIEIGRRRRRLVSGRHAVFEVLANPERDGRNEWMLLHSDEVVPGLVVASTRGWVVWSSIWRQHPDVVIRFDLSPADNRSTELQWVVTADTALLSPAERAHLLARLDEVVDVDLDRTLTSDGTVEPRETVTV